jgi:hypothetical protein
MSLSCAARALTTRHISVVCQKIISKLDVCQNTYDAASPIIQGHLQLFTIFTRYGDERE